jgi:hypothetical protein
MPSAWLIALPLPHAHLEGTLLPRGFFLGLGLIYLAALAVDRLAAHWRLPGAAAVLLLGLVIPSQWLTQAQPLGPLQVETLHRVSLALLIFYAGLKTDLRRIRGMTVAGLRLGCGGVVITVRLRLWHSCCSRLCWQMACRTPRRCWLCGAWGPLTAAPSRICLWRWVIPSVDG